jgi:Ca2+-binding EF-hand superfamily protein
MGGWGWGVAKQSFFSETDLKTMFSMFDITGRGTISAEQCNAALLTLLGSPKDCRGTLGASTQLLNCEQFVSVMNDALKPTH